MPEISEERSHSINLVSSHSVKLLDKPVISSLSKNREYPVRTSLRVSGFFQKDPVITQTVEKNISYSLPCFAEYDFEGQAFGETISQSDSFDVGSIISDYGYTTDVGDI